MSSAPVAFNPDGHSTAHQSPNRRGTWHRRKIVPMFAATRYGVSMSEVSTLRRLAAILAADVVGYSRMIGSDESGTLAALRRVWSDVFNPIVERHRGRIVKMMGDGAL